MKQLTVLFNGRKQAAYLLDEPHIVIGRGRSAHVALDGNPIVSRQHAVIRSELEAHVLEDLGGANGTYVNDALITQVRLREGDRITLGKHTLRYGAATPEAVSLKRKPRRGSEAEDRIRTSLVAALDDPPAKRAGRGGGGTMTASTRGAARAGGPTDSLPPWASGGGARAAATPEAGGSAAGAQQTVAASKEELEVLLEQMKVKSGPHLSISTDGGLDLVPLTNPPVLVGHTDECRIRLPGSRWFGKVAAALECRNDDWILVARSPFWSPVLVGTDRVRGKRKLATGDTISAGKLKIRFSRGEQQ